MESEPAAETQPAAGPSSGVVVNIGYHINARPSSGQTGKPEAFGLHLLSEALSGVESLQHHAAHQLRLHAWHNPQRADQAGPK